MTSIEDSFYEEQTLRMIFCGVSVMFSGLVLTLLVLSSSQPTFSVSPRKDTYPIARVRDISDDLTMISSMDGHYLQNKIAEMSSLDNPVSKRKKRSLIRLGLYAVTALLKGAKMVAANKDTKMYIKFGGYQRALRDFYSLGPAKIEHIKDAAIQGGTLTKGEVGDRTILFLKGDKFKSPSITIIKTEEMTRKNAPREVIMYRSKPLKD